LAFYISKNRGQVVGTLRLLLAFAVVIAHSRPLYGFGGIGGSGAVMAFYVISGFYMHLVLSTSYAGRPIAFYSNRLLRLIPAYWAVLALMFFVPAIFGHTGLFGYVAWSAMSQATDGSPASWFAAIPNLFIIGSDILRQFLFDTTTGELFPWHLGFVETNETRGAYNFLLVRQMWSVGNELLFYLAAPWIARLRNPIFIGVLAVAALMFFQAFGFNLAWTHLLPNYNFIFFVLGMAAYRGMGLITKLPGLMIWTLAIIPFAYFLFFPPLSTLTAQNLMLIWLPYSFTIPTLFTLSRDWRLDRWLGELSYPIYVCHHMFTTVTNAWFGESSAIVAFVLSAALAVVIVFFVERPVMNIRNLVKSRARTYSSPSRVARAF
jgi:peptidoglycan/LPS O-acetylase OafA/YrhL